MKRKLLSISECPYAIADLHDSSKPPHYLDLATDMDDALQRYVDNSERYEGRGVIWDRRAGKEVTLPPKLPKQSPRYGQIPGWKPT
jgi:hypothetical protein